MFINTKLIGGSVSFSGWRSQGLKISRIVTETSRNTGEVGERATRTGHSTRPGLAGKNMSPLSSCRGIEKADIPFPTSGPELWP